MMVGTLRDAIRALKLLSAAKSAWHKGLEGKMEPKNWKTKTGAIIGGIGTILLLVVQVIEGDMSLSVALPSALATVGAVIAVWGGRDAIAKIGLKETLVMREVMVRLLQDRLQTPEAARAADAADGRSGGMA